MIAEKSYNVNMQKVVAPILIILVIVAGSLIFVFTRLGGNQGILDTIKQTNETPSPAPDISNWKTYADNNYSFKYPPDWLVKEGKVVTIKNPTGSVAFIFSPLLYPYSINGEDLEESKQETEIKVNVDGKEYLATETVYSHSKAFVDLKIQKSKEHHIIFGTGYPAGEDRAASLSEYYANRDIVLSILASLQISE